MLTVADAASPAQGSFRDPGGRVYRLPGRILRAVEASHAGEFEQFLKTPVVDETGLTNYYDFSLAWNRGMRPDQFTRDDIDKIIGEWGLDLEPDTESIEMLVVKKVD